MIEPSPYEPPRAPLDEPSRPREESLPPGGEYDHSVPRSNRLGSAIIASFIFLGGGQLVKGHYRRFFTMWGVLVAAAVLAPLAAWAIDSRANTAAIAEGTAKIAYGLIWMYQLWDAAARP